MHPSDAELDRHVAGRLSRAAAGCLEGHLRSCCECRRRFDEAVALTRAPGRFRHLVAGGVVDLGIRDVGGKTESMLCGCGVELKRSFRTAAAARSYVRRTFRELFPGHRCVERCG